jgi:hypothetical protein
VVILSTLFSDVLAGRGTKCLLVALEMGEEELSN